MILITICYNNDSIGIECEVTEEEWNMSLIKTCERNWMVNSIRYV